MAPLPTLALCMIVKNAAATLRPCLESVVGVVDQIVVADTGSTDATCEIAREFGAVLLSAPWQDHFAEARNAALAGATTDWVLVLDADEELGEEARDTLRGLLEAPTVGGYLVPIREYVPFVTGSAWTWTILPNNAGHARAKDAPSYLVNTLCRLFRRSDAIFFTGRVHEMVQPQVEAAGFTVQLAPFCIHHYGHLAQAEALTRKRAFYHDLLQKRLQDDPNDITTLTMCGLDEWEIYHRPLEALHFFRRALELNPDSFETWLLTAKVLCAVHRYEEALAALDLVRVVEKDLHLQNTLRGDALYGLGRLSEARVAYQAALGCNAEDRLLQAKQAYIDIDLGDRDAAIESLQRAAADAPAQVEIHEFLVNACIRNGRIAEAADEAERFVQFDLREAFLLRAAKLRAQLQQWPRARAAAQQCVTLYPASIAARELLMMTLLALGEMEPAADEAERLASCSADPRAFLRAAGICAQVHDRGRVKRCLERGLAVFPNSAELQRALFECSPLPTPPMRTQETASPALPRESGRMQPGGNR